MENVLDTYALPYDPKHPQVCIDEKPYQLLSDAFESMPAKPGKVKREDYEYKREGTCNFFIVFEPLTQTRQIKVTKQRTAVDFANFMKEVSEMYPSAEKIKVVLDNLNTHNPGSFYQAFQPEYARYLTERFEFIYTPTHGSWLNMAEIEFSALERQCVRKRIPCIEEAQRNIKIWQEERNKRKVQINWCFTSNDARTKFKRFYQNITNL
jgi:transposase